MRVKRPWQPQVIMAESYATDYDIYRRLVRMAVPMEVWYGMVPETAAVPCLVFHCDSEHHGQKTYTIFLVEEQDHAEGDRTLPSNTS